MGIAKAQLKLGQPINGHLHLTRRATVHAVKDFSLSYPLGMGVVDPERDVVCET